MIHTKIVVFTIVLFSTISLTAENRNTPLNSFVKAENIKVNQDSISAEAFKLRFNHIQNEFETQQNLFKTGVISESKYLKHIKKLRKKELKLFKAVKQHKFKPEELTEYNYWYRGVLKFPTNIEQELLKRTSK
ncbi:hypothetical protein Q4566_11210 [Tamlana sp. 2_MG-2023]|uniref:hypothetical protein n=1 Tax=unclassified Tamlana TaxID=2614803 RepID=UPI0026E126D7|nr:MULTISPECIES: hypothetical protein [unclassified Tamlana]MDO6760770.1 hypothetical protein [Tamlana sp. 2_MG-2023]MDO6791026.1 hypothetical protein [Tamlana sp. 1_MG-2023]